MHKIWVVCRREFGVQIRKISFWLTTLGLPIFMFLTGILVVGIGFWTISKTMKKGEKPKDLPFGIVDTVGMVSLDALEPKKERSASPLDDPDVKKIFDTVNLPEFLEKKVVEAANSTQDFTRAARYQLFESTDQAETALEEKAIRGYLLLPQGFPVEAAGELVWYDRKHDMRTTKLERHLRNQLLARNYEEANIPLVLRPLREAKETYRFNLEKKKKEKGFNDFDFKALGAPMIFAFAMLMVVMFSSDRLLRGLMEEKQNRVIEILLSSVSADQLMAGKVLGIGFIGLLQLGIWTLLAFLPASSLFTFFSIGLADLAVSLIFFVLGYFLLSIMMLGLGSIGNTFQEASQWSLVCSLLALSPAMLWPLVFQDMDSWIVHFFTYFPFTSPLMVIIRFGADMISPMQVGISLLILLVSNYFAVKFGAKLFRLGILLTGKTPSPLTVWKMFRAS